MKCKIYNMWLVMTGITALVSCGSGNSAQQQAPPPTAVNVYTVQEGSAVFDDIYPGTITALNQVDVRPQVSGYITGIYFTEGQLVHKGDKLYTIDPQQYRGAYEQAVASLNVAEANLAKSQQDADRYQELSKQDAIAKQVLDHAMADLDASRKQVDAAKANVQAVQANLKYTTITAPFTGTIGISAVKLGAAVSPGQTILNTISSDNPICVDFSVDQKQIPRIVQLQQQKINDIRDSTFTISLTDQSVYPYPGHIFLIDRAVDPQTGTIKTRLVFPNDKNFLRAGMTCNVRVKNSTAEKTLLIPYKAVMEQMGEYFVFVVNEGKVTQHKVTLGPRVRGKVAVKEGLELNQQIVTDGVQKLKDGAAVAIATDSTKKK
ncbi:MAG TPA: efflux RND transporter periplasmic adaptor subunit [Puia sp.]|nr:efflux RND transporter periplasmic adaptor subunit [Puia sp.]